MSKKTIELEIVQCDYVDENGDRCVHEGYREKMGTCSICGIDVCGTHSQVSYVTSRVISNSMLRAGQHRYSYCLCIEHIDDLINFVVDKFGDQYEIPPNHYGGGVGETQVLETHNLYISSKPGNSK